MTSSAPAPRPTDGMQAVPLYLLLADISGYTSFLAGVERTHGVDFSDGMPAGYEILAELLDAIVQRVQTRFEIVQLEGDAVFGVAPTAELDGDGAELLRLLKDAYRAFLSVRAEAMGATDHVCTACPVVGSLDLKMVLHRGVAVRGDARRHTEMHGQAVNVAHRLLKNTVRARIGAQPYLFMTDDAASQLGLGRLGMRHIETYPDVGSVSGRILSLA